MGARDLPDMYALSPRAYISGKSLVPMLQLLHVTSSHLRSKEFISIHKVCIPHSKDTTKCTLVYIQM